jgi:SAM-dependent methyltransferase
MKLRISAWVLSTWSGSSRQSSFLDYRRWLATAHGRGSSGPPHVGRTTIGALPVSPSESFRRTTRWSSHLQSSRDERQESAERGFSKRKASSPLSNPDGDDFAACWAANSWSINPDGDTAIDDILQGLHSPAPQSLFVIERALRRARQEKQSIQFVLEQCQYLVKDNLLFCFNDDQDTDLHVLQNHRPGIDWILLPEKDSPPSGWKIVPTCPTTLSSSQIAAAILAVVADASESQESLHEETVDQLVQQLRGRLSLTLGTDIRGRTAADTAFSLCLAGVADTRLFERLTRISWLEMNRVKQRSSRRFRDVLHVIEKLAAAGVRGPEVQKVYELATESTALQGTQFDSLRESLKDPNEFHLLSTRPLLWLWRFSARQTKANVNKMKAGASLTLASDANSIDWLSRFKDPSRPLVLDIGCGLGVSLIGLASVSHRASPGDIVDQPCLNGVAWKDCNFLGGDLSLLGVRFGQGIAARWQIDGHLQYTLAAAEDLVDQVDRLYPGKVALIMIQFPSPYRLKESGNTQLPSTSESGFMVTEALMQRVATLVRRSNGRVMLQSNCEDVAVTMHDMGQATGLSAVPIADPVLTVDDLPRNQRTPQRTEEWIRLGGHRALGTPWSRVSLLPKGYATETEASCAVHETPVHRCLLRPPSE